MQKLSIRLSRFFLPPVFFSLQLFPYAVFIVPATVSLSNRPETRDIRIISGFINI